MFSRVHHLLVLSNGDAWIGTNSMFYVLDKEHNIVQSRILRDDIVKFIETKDACWIVSSRKASKWTGDEWIHYPVRPTILDVCHSSDSFFILRKNTKHVFFIEEFDHEWNYVRTIDAQPDERANPAWGHLIYQAKQKRLIMVPRNDSKILMYDLAKESGWKAAKGSKSSGYLSHTINIPVVGEITQAKLKHNSLWIKCQSHLLTYSLGHAKWTQRKFEGNWFICSFDKDPLGVSYLKDDQAYLWYPEKDETIKASNRFIKVTSKYFVDIKRQLYRYT